MSLLTVIKGCQGFSLESSMKQPSRTLTSRIIKPSPFSTKFLSWNLHCSLQQSNALAYQPFLLKHILPGDLPIHLNQPFSPCSPLHRTQFLFCRIYCTFQESTFWSFPVHKAHFFQNSRILSIWEKVLIPLGNKKRSFFRQSERHLAVIWSFPYHVSCVIQCGIGNHQPHEPYGLVLKSCFFCGSSEAVLIFALIQRI